LILEDVGDALETGRCIADHLRPLVLLGLEGVGDAARAVSGLWLTTPIAPIDCTRRAPWPPIRTSGRVVKVRQ
jgi:hypothetical protein